MVSGRTPIWQPQTYLYTAPTLRGWPTAGLAGGERKPDPTVESMSLTCDIPICPGVIMRTVSLSGNASAEPWVPRGKAGRLSECECGYYAIGQPALKRSLLADAILLVTGVKVDLTRAALAYVLPASRFTTQELDPTSARHLDRDVELNLGTTEQRSSSLRSNALRGVPRRSAVRTSDRPATACVAAPLNVRHCNNS